MKHKDYYSLNEYFEYPESWSEPIVLGEDEDEIIEQLEHMLDDAKKYGVMRYPQS